jgi:hypothetical protein
MVPKARRISDSTITMRVNEVTMIRIAGARDSTVMSRKICNTTVGALDCSLVSNPIEKKGVEIPGSAPQLFPVGIKSRHKITIEAVQTVLNRLLALKAHRNMGMRPASPAASMLIVTLIKLMLLTLLGRSKLCGQSLQVIRKRRRDAGNFLLQAFQKFFIFYFRQHRNFII